MPLRRIFTALSSAISLQKKARKRKQPACVPLSVVQQYPFGKTK